MLEPGKRSVLLFLFSLRMEALLNEWLWQEEFWLPPGARWQDFRVKDHVPLPRDLLYTLPLAFAFIALRYVFERYDAPVLFLKRKRALYSRPLGAVFGLSPALQPTECLFGGPHVWG